MVDRCVLIVEDDPSVGKLITTLLRVHGVRTEIAADGLAALERLRDETPCLVVLDLALPRIDGWEILSTLQQAAREIPVIVVTAHGQGDSARKAKELGAAYYFEKPFEPTQFLAAAQELLAATDTEPIED